VRRFSSALPKSGSAFVGRDFRGGFVGSRVRITASSQRCSATRAHAAR